MKICIEYLVMMKQVVFFREGFFNFDNHIAIIKYLFSVAYDSCAGMGVFIVFKSGVLTRVFFNHYFVAASNIRPYAGWCKANAIFMFFDLFNSSYLHKAPYTG